MTTVYDEPEIQASYDPIEDRIIIYIGKMRAWIKLTPEAAEALDWQLYEARKSGRQQRRLKRREKSG